MSFLLTNLATRRLGGFCFARIFLLLDVSFSMQPSQNLSLCSLASRLSVALLFVRSDSPFLAELRLEPECGLTFGTKNVVSPETLAHPVQTDNPARLQPQPNNTYFTMASKNPSDTNLQKIIQEVDDLQLPESARGYFTEVSATMLTMSSGADFVQLLKHIDTRDREWAKVVKKWEHYEAHSKSFNREMVGIMSNVQDIFLKDDTFLKQLYKGRMEEVGATLKDDSA